MLKLNKREAQRAIVVLLLIICAVACRFIGKNVQVPDVLDMFVALLRTGIYMGLIIAWGVSVKRRILDSAVRRYLLTISVLLLFWLTVRSCKYFFLDGLDTVMRFGWYAFYIPMILIPLMAVFTAACLGEPKNYIVPRILKFLYIPGLVLNGASVAHHHPKP